MRGKITFIGFCASGYRGWLISFEHDPNGRWLCTPTAGDSYSLIDMYVSITA